MSVGGDSRLAPVSGGEVGVLAVERMRWMSGVGGREGR